MAGVGWQGGQWLRRHMRWPRDRSQVPTTQQRSKQASKQGGRLKGSHHQEASPSAQAHPTPTPILRRVAPDSPLSKNFKISHTAPSPTP